MGGGAGKKRRADRKLWGKQLNETMIRLSYKDRDKFNIVQKELQWRISSGSRSTDEKIAAWQWAVIEAECHMARMETREMVENGAEMYDDIFAAQEAMDLISPQS